MPGDRRDVDIRAVGERFARFDHVIIKEDEDLRGRQPGAVTGLLREALTAGGLDPSRIEEVRDEAAAIRHGAAMLGEDDVLVILAADVPVSLRAVEDITRGQR
jgi:cyanophycin synthetase